MGDKNIKVDLDHVDSTDTAEGLKRYAVRRLARRKAEKQSEYDEEAGDSGQYITPGEHADERADKVWKVIRDLQNNPALRKK